MKYVRSHKISVTVIFLVHWLEIMTYVFLILQVIIIDFFWDFLQIYYVLSKNPDPYPPKLFGYLNKIATTVGAEGVWVESNYAIYDKFSKTGKSAISRLFISSFYVSHKFYKVIGCELRDPIWRH